MLVMEMENSISFVKIAPHWCDLTLQFADVSLTDKGRSLGRDFCLKIYVSGVFKCAADGTQSEPRW